MEILPRAGAETPNVHWMTPHTTPPAEPESSYVSIAAAADLCAVSTQTMRRWISEGRIPAFRVGPKAIRLRTSDVRRFVEDDPLIL